MPRRPIQTVIALAGIVSAIHLLDSHEADAQGLLRRIQSRIQSRIAAPPVDPQQQPQTPPEVDRPVAPADSAAPQGRRIRPILPSGEDADAGRFGGSILAPRNEPPTRAEAAATSDRPTLGIDVLQSRSAIAGVRVVRIRDESLADEAGLRVDDIIVSIDGVETPTIAAVATELSGKSLGQRIAARVVRGNEAIDVAIPLVSHVAVAAKPNMEAPSPPTMPSLPAPPSAPVGRAGSPTERLGVNVSDAQGLRGAVVTEVTPGTAGASAGMEVGDRIVSLNGRLIADVAALRDRLGRLVDGDAISLRLVRNGGLINKEIQMGQPVAKSAGGAADPGPSAFQGIGSMLGGLLGRQPAATEPRKNDPSRTAPGLDDDVMALGDDEQVRRVGFEEKINVNDLPAEADLADGPIGLTDDPPSLDILELPSLTERDSIDRNPNERAEALQTVAEIREEIRRLEARLRAIEAEKRKTDAADQPEAE